MNSEWIVSAAARAQMLRQFRGAPQLSNDAIVIGELRRLTTIHNAVTGQIPGADMTAVVHQSGLVTVVFYLSSGDAGQEVVMKDFFKARLWSQFEHPASGLTRLELQGEQFTAYALIHQFIQ